MSYFPLRERLESTSLEEQEPWLWSPVAPSTSDTLLLLFCPVLLWKRTLFKVKAMIVSPNLFAHGLISTGPWKTELQSPVSSPKSFWCTRLLRTCGCSFMSKVSTLGSWWEQIMPVATCPFHYRGIVPSMRFGTGKYWHHFLCTLLFPGDPQRSHSPGRFLNHCPCTVSFLSVPFIPWSLWFTWPHCQWYFGIAFFLILCFLTIAFPFWSQFGLSLDCPPFSF